MRLENYKLVTTNKLKISDLTKKNFFTEKPIGNTILKIKRFFEKIHKIKT